MSFELTLPNPPLNPAQPQQGEWNGKLIMMGGGGFDGFVPNFQTLRGALNLMNEGYAIVGTDSGTTNAPYSFLNNKQELINYGYLARHLVSITAKDIIKRYYNKIQSESYFIGCSKGGQEGLIEVQRYPHDFDGVIVGAPAIPLTKVLLGFVWNEQAMYIGSEPKEQPIINPNKLNLLTDIVLKKCSAVDRIINNPWLCHFNPAQDLPTCTNNVDAPHCFTANQINALIKVYNGTNINGVQLYPGFLPGLERGGHWQAWIVGNPFSAAPTGVHIYGAPDADYALGEGALEYEIFNNPKYQLNSFNFQNPQDVNRVLSLSTELDAVNPDISAFQARGGKLIIWQGWNDPALSPIATVNYYQNILATMGGHHQTDNFVRLFMAPSVGHCGGGVGPAPSDDQLITSLNNWVVNDIAPDEVPAINFAGTVARPLCPYPKIAVVNDGVDSTTPNNNNAANFHCAEPGQ